MYKFLIHNLNYAVDSSIDILYFFSRCDEMRCINRLFTVVKYSDVQSAILYKSIFQ